MSEPDTPLPDRKARKSVAFTDEQIVVDADGNVTTSHAMADDTKETRTSHAPRTPPLAAALGDFTDHVGASLPPAAAADSAAGDQIDLSMVKKKKKKPVAAAEDEDGAAPAAGDEGALDLTMKKRKKKKKIVDDAAEDDFAAKLKNLDLEGEGAAGEDEDGEGAGKSAAAAAKAAAAASAKPQVGVTEDMTEGKGIWAHGQTAALPYHNLLGRLYAEMAEKNPEHAASGSKTYKIPPPQCLREGNRRTVFANIGDICARMGRTEEHVMAYLFAELGTSGSVDGSQRLVIKGRFQQKQIETVLRKYILEYVTCKTCRSHNTDLNKGENRLYFITCKACGSRRSVAAIKTGFSAQVGRRKRQA